MRLYHREYGAGPPLVVLHGVLGSSANWQTIARALADEFRVVTMDLRNHGRSPHAPTITYPEMVDDLLETLDHLGLQRTSLLGHSMGGKVAMALALAHGDRVDKLVVADMAPVPFTFRPSAILAALREVDLDALGSRQDADAALRGAIPDRRVRGFLLQNLTRAHGRFRWRINLPALERHSRDLADFPAPFRDATFEGPTLFLRGEDSDYVQRRHEPRIRALFPKALIRTLDDTGHWLHAEAPERFTAAVRGFLETDP